MSIKGFKINVLNQFGSGEKVTHQKREELFIPLYCEDRDNTLNVVTRFYVRDAHYAFLDNLVDDVAIDDNFIIKIQIKDYNEPIIIKCTPFEFDQFIAGYCSPNYFIDEANRYGVKITSIIEVHEDGGEKKIFSQKDNIKNVKKDKWVKRGKYSVGKMPEQVFPARIKISKRYKYGQWEYTSYVFKENTLLNLVEQPINSTHGDWIDRDINGVLFFKINNKEGIVYTYDGYYLWDGRQVKKVNADQINVNDYPGLIEFKKYYYGE